MIKINEILEHVNKALKTHYFKDITSYGVAELVVREDSDEKDVTRPTILGSDGEYKFIQRDTNGLNIYHRIVGEIESEEDADGGFGKNQGTGHAHSHRHEQKEGLPNDHAGICIPFHGRRSGRNDCQQDSYWTNRHQGNKFCFLC